MPASEGRISIRDVANKRFWQLTLLTAAATVGASSHADAALYYWNGYGSVYYGDAEPAQEAYRQKPRRAKAKAKKDDAVLAKETGAKPQGPLVIAISIDQQAVRVYDRNGLYAESPVSTGMKGHSTPMGVFSVIQKQKFHRSNIYSGAPMPFMQRITWSGVAMHAGVLPGYPASHGCIRMPNAFAVKMYSWTRMGARVIITPGTITPESFSHPLLVTQKVVPVAEDILKMDAPLGAKGDKGVDKSESSIELRTSVGHAEAPASLRDNTHTADASGTTPPASASVTMSDAPSRASGDNIAATTKPAGDDKTVGEAQGAGATDTTKTEVSASDPVNAEAKAEPKAELKAESKPDAAKADAARKTETTADKPAATTTADAPDAKKDSARLPGLARADVTKRAGQIAVFISRKDSRLYVRQNFAPLFDVPVTIAPSDRPLGTHVFTAEADKADTNLLRWSVVSLPTRHAVRAEDDERPARRRKVAGPATIAAEAKPQPAPDSPAEALDRITIPAEAMARITEALGTGGSIIVSDLGVNSGETGEGTDFIVPLR